MTSAASAHFKTAQRRQRCVPRSMFTGRRWRWQLTTRLRSSSPPVLVSMRYGVAALSCPRPTPCPMPISFQMDIHLEMMHAIGEVQDAPVVADIDTGFGNAVNVAYVIPRYEAAGVAAVVMEDKTFPKDSSLRAGGRQELVPIAEFQGKLAAAKAAGAVLVIARTEALIAGLGQKEALRRGEAYAEAGADGVLIHSKQKTPDEILAFCRAWPGRVPLVLVPTSYPQLSFADVTALGKVGLIICGNHAIRAAVAAMQSTFRRILAEGGIAGVESDIASVAEVFALQGDEHMRKLEKAYLR